MAILTGRYGKISYDPTGTGTPPPVEVLSLNKWALSEETEYEDVSCFGDPNRVYVPGLIDIGGTVEGFWNSAELTLWDAAIAPTPGILELMPNRNEATFKWSGKAYMDASIDCTLSAPKVTGNFKAAAAWTTPGTP
jgi:hypothetical protein